MVEQGKAKTFLRIEKPTSDGVMFMKLVGAGDGNEAPLVDLEEAIAAAEQAVKFDQDVDPAIVRVLLDELARVSARP